MAGAGEATFQLGDCLQSRVSGVGQIEALCGARRAEYRRQLIIAEHSL